LDIYVVLEYIEILHLLLNNLPSQPILANPTWMGCFTNTMHICEALYVTGVPVLLVWREEFIFLTMNIIQHVCLTYPDSAVKAVYTENGVAKPFPAI
ncbi:hypothetical protein EDC04DRAFT_2545920, partial [Pisolithus marmoratus]